MREIRYVDGSVVVSDAMSDALLDYSRELARKSIADVVDVPVIFDGHDDNVKMLLGPASQLIDLPSSATGVQDDSSAVEEIRRRSESLRPHSALPDDTSHTDYDEDVESL
jgi:hypothetical protein